MNRKMSSDSGWNAVIHHPSELELQNWEWDENDGEPGRELPSTVDMEAIKGGGSWDPATGPNGADTVNSEDDSDSEDESSGESDGSCSYSDSNSESDDDSSGGDDSESNSDCTSEHSEQTFSIRETNFEQGSLKLKIAMKGPSKKEEVEKPKCEKNKKMVAKITKTMSRDKMTSECSTEESDNSENALSQLQKPQNPPLPQQQTQQQQQQQQAPQQQQQPLQEINQEDLSAILHDQENEDAPFDGFEDSESGRLVSKAIERMSLGADSDMNENQEQNSVPIYSSSLLQQFVEKTALLSEPRKRRGRSTKKSNEPEYASASNVSPDSGIQSVNNSPLHLAGGSTSPTASRQSPLQSKPVVNVDRVLYPPKRKPGRPAKTVSSQPRGPGRPKIKPEIAAKMKKIDKCQVAKAKENSRKKVVSKKEEKATAKKKKSGTRKLATVAEKSHFMRRKCLRKLVGNKKMLKSEASAFKTRAERVKARKDNSTNGKNVAEKVASKGAAAKENRETGGNRKQQGVSKKMVVATTTRRVLKENKGNKKTTTSADANVAGLKLASETLKTEDQEAGSKKSENMGQVSSSCHSRRHRHKHRRRQLNPPKTPVRINPAIVQELDKLIDDFAKFCTLGRNGTSSTSSELPQIFRIKKMSKKRKGAASEDEQQKLKRRPKKEKVSASLSKDSELGANTAVASNPNEQRLPLKKRHYRVSSSPHSSLSSSSSGAEVNPAESHIEEAIEATVKAYAGDKEKKSVPVTPKKRHRDGESTVTLEKDEKPAAEKVPGPGEQPKRKKKLLKDLRVTVMKLVTEPAILEKLEKVAESKKEAEKKEEKEEAVAAKEAAPEKKKVKRRKAINRTGFPTIKKRKKKIPEKIEDAPPEKIAKKSEKAPVEKSSKTAKDVGTETTTKKVENVVSTKTTKKVEIAKKMGNSASETSTKKNENSISENSSTKIVENSVVEKIAKKIENSITEKTGKKVENAALGKAVKKAEEKVSKKTEEKRPKKSEEKVEKKVEEKITKKSDDGVAGKNSKKLEKEKAIKEICSGQLRVRKDLVASAVKTEKVKESMIIDEDESLETSFARYSKNRIAELGAGNIRKLDKVKVKCINNNNKKLSSPCLAALRNVKKLKLSDAASDVTSEVHENVKTATNKGRRKQTQLKKKPIVRDNKEDDKLESSGKKKTSQQEAHCASSDKKTLQKDAQKEPICSKETVPSWNYRKIRLNVYYDVKPTNMYESQACECKMETCCGDDCINRMCFSECSPQLCPCGDKCKNQKIQKHDWSPGLKRFMTENKGWGVKTLEAIKNGVFILEYVGEVTSEREFKSRMATRYANDTHHYCLHLDGGLVIDGHRMGGYGRFVNHSCEPNCEMQKWSVHGLPRMALFASRDINPGEELTYDYNFALFNPLEGQQCKCGSTECRGVIGGKSQRIAKPAAPTPTQVDSGSDKRNIGRPRKKARKSTTVMTATCKSTCTSRKISDAKISNMKPLSNQQRSFTQQHQVFLVRNLEKLRRLKHLNKEKNGAEPKVTSDVLFSSLNSALSTSNSRTVRTRRLAQAQDDPEVSKTAKLAKVLKSLYKIVVTATDENKQLLCCAFMTLPSKRKLAEYYEKIQDPIDLTMVEQGISNGFYKNAELFDQDVIRVFDNNVKFFGRTSEIGIAAARLKKLYLGSKADFINAITQATGLAPSTSFLAPRGSAAGEEDVIRCICGLHRDEGLMIQCERCLVWQHCDCVKADTTVESYLCERCLPRDVELEIALEAENEEGEDKKHYLTLLRGDLQLRQGDTVYVLRDTPEKHTYKTIQKLDYEQMDIFRIERLWKNAKGERFVYGHNYLRPHETYHEPTRKFYENEIVCAPLYEAVPCDLVAERCWVLDPNTYRKGRPVGSKSEHTYICEYRVDRAARLFSKVARSRHLICTKPYAFETFLERIKLSRTYLPHNIDGIQMQKSKEKKKNSCQETEVVSCKNETSKIGKQELQVAKNARSQKRRLSENSSTCVSVASITQREEQRKRLNGILENLLEKMPNKKEPLDISFILEHNRRKRKRPSGFKL